MRISFNVQLYKDYLNRNTRVWNRPRRNADDSLIHLQESWATYNQTEIHNGGNKTRALIIYLVPELQLSDALYNTYNHVLSRHKTSHTLHKNSVLSFQPTATTITRRLLLCWLLAKKALVITDKFTSGHILHLSPRWAAINRLFHIWDIHMVRDM